LGNPGKKYEKTPHNVGFRVVDEFVRKNNFPAFKLSKKFKALISEGVFNNKKIILAKPQNFINLSGKAVRKIVLNYKLKATNVFVVHDDIDLPLVKIRISKGRGSAGHKGVQSIINELGTKNFVRFRVGIQPKLGKPKNPENFVLQPFNKEENKILKEVVKKTAEAVEAVLKKGLEMAMNKFNK